MESTASIRNQALAQIARHDWATSATKPKRQSTLELIQQKQSEIISGRPESISKSTAEFSLGKVIASDTVQGMLSAASELLLYTRTKEALPRPSAKRVLGNYVDLTA